MSQKKSKKKVLKALQAEKAKRDALGRELTHGRLTLKRAEQDWKKLCESIKIPILQEELILSWNSFERLVEMKDFQISLYMDDIRNQEEMYMMNFQSHEDNVGRFIELFSDNLHEIHDENDFQLKALIKQSLDDWKELMTSTENAEMYMKTMSYRLEMQLKENIKHTKTINFGKLNEENTKNIHNNQKLASILETKLENTWYRLEKIQENYLKKIKSNKKDYDLVIATDEANKQMIKKELKKLMNLNELIKKLTMKMNKLLGSLGEKLAYLNRERDDLEEYFFALRSKLQEDRANDEIKRALITVEFAKAFENLETRMKIGEKLMKSVRMIRSFETIQEKVLPYPKNSYPEERSEAPSQLKMFWQKVAQVQAQRYTLNEERVFLKLENKRLRREIHRHCQCLDCPSLPPIPARAGKIPLTEGNVMMEKLKKTSNKSIQRETEIDEEVDETKIDSKNEIESVSLLFGSTFLARI